MVSHRSGKSGPSGGYEADPTSGGFLALIKGTGAGQPLGVLNGGATISVAKDAGQTAGTLTATNIGNMWSRFAAPCRKRGLWFCCEDAEGQFETFNSASTAALYVPQGAGGNAAFEYGPWGGAHVQLAQAVGEGLARAAVRGGAGMAALGGAVGLAAAASAGAAIITARHAVAMRELDDAARAAKLSMTALKDLNTAGKNVGIYADKMNSEMGAFAVKLREAQVAGGELADFLKANHIAIKDAAGELLPVQQIFGKIAEMVLQTTNEMDRLKTMETVGFSGEMLRLIERQTEAVRAFAASSISERDRITAKELSDGEKILTVWNKVYEGIGSGIVRAGARTIEFDQAVLDVGGSFLTLSSAATSAFADIVSGASKAKNEIRSMFGELDLSTKFGAKASQGGHDSFAGYGLNAFGGWGDGSAGGAGGVDPDSLYKDKDKDKKKASKAKSGGADDTRKDASEEARAAIDAARATFDQKKSLLDAYANLHIISTEQQIAGTRSAAEEEYAAQKAALEKELRLQDLKPSQRRAINDQIQKIEAQHQMEMQKLQFQAVENEIKDWTHMVDTMSGSLSSGLSGMIEGTKTFGQSMQSLVQGVERQFVKMGADLIANWTKAQLANVALSVMGEGQKTAAAAAGASARTGIGAGEASAGLATIIPGVLKNITAAGAETFAGVFGFLAPVMGPLAAGPAAAAEAMVLSVSPFDVGAWELSKDQLALVHSGEMVMPAAESGAFRSMLSNAANGGAGGQSAASGDTHVHNWNINALDAGSVKSWLGNNSRQIMQAMNQAVKNGDHLGLRRLGGGVNHER